jgi:hypothetical protein
MFEVLLIFRKILPMKNLLLFLALSLSGYLYSQQIPDTSYNPPIAEPQYEAGMGSVVFIDEGHFNFHTKEGGYKAFAKLLERDGYKVLPYQGEFAKGELSRGDILVISNALNEFTVENWYLPTPSAFTTSEIKVVKKWVKKGGSLFLIADHMPMAGAAEDLAREFGFEFTNGFAVDTITRGPAFFTTHEGSLNVNLITQGRDTSESVEHIASFTGQAFRLPGDATPILTFRKNFVNLLPDTAWVFDASTRVVNVKGWSQGAFKIFGKGRVVVFGEAAMFTAQLAGPQKIKAGMNSDVAPENYQLLLNIIHWLDGKLDEKKSPK